MRTPGQKIFNTKVDFYGKIILYYINKRRNENPKSLFTASKSIAIRQYESLIC